MRVMCKNCNEWFDAEDGELVAYCPHCGAEKVVHQRRTYTPEQARAAMNNRQHETKDPGLDGLCFFLGLFLSIFGLLVSAIISGRMGAVSALYGMLGSLALGGLYLALHLGLIG